MPAAEIAKPAKKPRDVRLDFFRGISMFVIFIAHVPANAWFSFIPARFGFSSAAELFVFCSGLASGFAFGGLFVRNGFLAGTARVIFRIWQVYWAHIALVLCLIAASAWGHTLTGIDYPGALGLGALIADPVQSILHIMMLSYVPAYTDILPLYIVLLGMIPVVMALSLVSRWLAMGSLLALWLYAHLTHLNLPLSPPQTVWYFSPFAWQLLFFTGFSFGMGWIPVPALEKGVLFKACVAFVLISVPLNFWWILETFTWLDDIREAILPPGNQTYLSPLRFFHFLALAYVVLTLVDGRREMLARATPIVTVGQQSLATFLASTTLVWLGGMALDQTGRGFAATALVNLAGFAFIVAVAYLAAFFKSAPWSKRRAVAPPVPDHRAEQVPDAPRITTV